MKSFIFILVLVPMAVLAQDKTLPYAEIPVYPASFTAGSVASRLIDGLGFRFYWATEGLRPEDLAYRPNADARTSEETITHIYEMSYVILNATTKTMNAPGQAAKLSFAEMRRQTLENLKGASDRLRVATDNDFREFKILFKRGDSVSEFPFWNEINGPISDCLWHVGQIVSFRRSSGNPFSEKVNVFTGTVMK